ncbi:hypothetical protein BO70DRAFT_152438 [Aspergillus heteromorphus CBS 117.55]|uniref:Uncharacterized protein n=1 Tax=Aspergillus heteromorphus CBS 117.55 TaxID=1448321 RepID=A0A317V4V7_9EURO|nr:uncharacterized protein BO70DRAFT_152438 [Aspergillus heteromorphus CBS 117.55]PWY68679.1 hypothetical protein BO70DRAFT_152438 [Aspergillus heteromorphus CBS 117.55]
MHTQKTQAPGNNNTLIFLIAVNGIRPLPSIDLIIYISWRSGVRGGYIEGCDYGVVCVLCLGGRGGCDGDGDGDRDKNIVVWVKLGNGDGDGDGDQDRDE